MLNTAMPIKWPLSRLKRGYRARGAVKKTGMDENQTSGRLFAYPGIKAAMRKNGLHSVCEEASCPNLAECFNHGTATFMILGAICTRRCPFCDVAHGRPVAPDANEPQKLAQTIADMALRYVVITSVDRDDLRDGGAQHFADCITAIREKARTLRLRRWCRISVAVWIARSIS